MRRLGSSFESTNKSTLFGSSHRNSSSWLWSLPGLLVKRISVATECCTSITQLIKCILINRWFTSTVSYLMITTNGSGSCCRAKLTWILSDHKRWKILEISYFFWHLRIKLRLILRIINWIVLLLAYISMRLLNLPYGIQVRRILVQQVLLYLWCFLIENWSTGLCDSFLPSK